MLWSTRGIRRAFDLSLCEEKGGGGGRQPSFCAHTGYAGTGQCQYGAWRPVADSAFPALRHSQEGDVGEDKRIVLGIDRLAGSGLATLFYCDLCAGAFEFPYLRHFPQDEIQK